MRQERCDANDTREALFFTGVGCGMECLASTPAGHAAAERIFELAGSFGDFMKEGL